MFCQLINNPPLVPKKQNLWTYNLLFSWMYNPDQYLLPFKNGHDPLYNKHEKAIIDKYEEDYCTATSPLSRHHVVVAQLCPELFNYWVLECGIAITAIDEFKRVNVSNFSTLLDMAHNLLWTGNTCLCSE